MADVLLRRRTTSACTPDLTLNLGLRYELSDRAARLLRRHRSRRASRALVPGRSKKDTNNLAPRVGFAWSPRSSNSAARRRQDGRPRRLRDGLRRALLQPADRERLELPARAWPLPRTDVQNVYPNLLPASGAAIFNPLAAWTNSPEDTQNPRTRSTTASRSSASSATSSSRSATRAAGAATASTRSTSTRPVVTPAQAALVARDAQRRTPSRASRRGASIPQFGNRTLIPAVRRARAATTSRRARSTTRVFVSREQALLPRLPVRRVATPAAGSMSNNDASLGEGGTARGS